MKAFKQYNRMSFTNSATALQQAIRRRFRTAKEMVVASARSIALLTVIGFTGLSATSEAQLTPEWVSRVPVGSAFAAGIKGLHLDPDGVIYITGISGPSPNTDITTVSLATDGSTRWSQVWNSPGSGADQARGLTRGPGNLLYVVGNTPGPDFFANVLVLAYDATNGALLKTIRYSSGPGNSESGASIVTDAAGNIYLTGETTGDGGDVLTLKLDSAGHVLWRRVWDGPAFSPFSGDTPVKILLDPSGDVLVAIYGIMSSNHPDYVVVKYDRDDGSSLWESTWGVTGGDFPTDMEIDSAGDVYVTGTGIDFINKYSTIKLRGSDGELLWQFYDGLGSNNGARSLFVDSVGGVFITGGSDPDGDISNFNDDFFTVKRDAATGALLWTHVYGAPCIGCFDAPSDVRADPDGNVFVVGSTSSPPYSNDVILFVLDTASGQEINRGLVFNTGAEIPYSGALRFDAAFNLYDGGQIYNANTGTVDLSVTKWTSLVAGGGGIPCEDLVSFQVRCKPSATGDRLQAKLTLTDTSHSGEQVTITVDGNPNSVTINGNQAKLQINNPGLGQHTVELTDPAGCFATAMPSCD
jgi:PQQ-like domain